MKLKRFLAFVVSLAMVLSIVPAFSLTASAASYTPDELVSFADYNFIAHTAAIGNWNSIQLGDSQLDGTTWEGWTSDGTSARVYSISSEGLFIAPDGSSTAVNWTASDDVKTGTADKDFMVLTWNSSMGGWLDLGFTDQNGKLFDSFRYAHNSADGINYHWANDGWPYTGFGPATSEYTWTDGGNGSGVAASRTTYAAVYCNDEDGDGYTVSYYYLSGSTYLLIGTKTFATGTINGFNLLTFRYVSGDFRIHDFKIYAGNYPAASDASTIAAALNSLSVDSMSGGAAISLPATATDAMGTTVDVSWTSSNTSVISNSGTVTQTYNVETVTLTPSATFDNATVTGSAKTVTVLPKALAGATTYAVGDSYYNIGSTNLLAAVANVDFSGDDWDNGWTTGTGTALDGGNFVRNTVNDVTYVSATANGGSSDANSIITTFSNILTVGNTYVLRFVTDSNNVNNSQYRWVGYSDGTKLISGIATSGVETKTIVFDATATDLKFNFCWLEGACHFTNFELYEATDAATTVTLNIKGTDGTVVKTLTYNGLTGETANFAAQSFSANGVFYTTEAVSYTVGTADATYTITATADTTKIATTNNFSYNFNTGAVIWAGDNGANASAMDQTISIGWNDFRQTIMTFPIPVLDGELISAIDLHVNVGFTNNATSPYTVYAIDPTLVGDGTMDPQITGYTWSAKDNAIAAMGGIQVGYADVAKNSESTITLDLSNAGSLTKDGTLALLIVSSGQAYTYSSTTAYPPYLSSTYETISSITYSLNYVDEDGNSIGNGLATTVDYAPGTQYGYDDEVICPNLSIPAISGYIFKSKSVSGTTITLTYAVDGQEDYFFDNITDMDTRFVSLNMLGSHDAFTAGVDETRYDAAAVAAENEAARNAMTFGSLSTSMSVTQDLTALGQLQAGARYFDTRLSRSTSDASYLLKTAPHTNGVFYTMHGLLFDEFEPALYSIAQWAATHPGEIIVLDFQEYFDDGHATADSWRDLHTLLTKTGVMEYVTIGNQSIKDVTYGQLTNNGTKCGIVLFGRAVATNASVGKFILRGDTSGAFNGKVYSNYETGLSSTIGSSFSTSYVQAQADYLDQFTSGDHPIYWMFRVMQAQSESSNLLSQASSDNTSLYNALQSNPEWLTELPVVMVNRIGTNTDNIVTLLRECNVPTVTVNYVNNGTTVYSEVGGLVGTLYTNDGFYSTPVYKLVNDANGEYYVSETFYTNHSSNTITPVIKGSTVEVDVTKLGNVYTTRLINGVHCVLNANLTDNGAYTGMDNFGAFTWGSDHDRIGIAVLEADADASAYMLTGTEARKYFNSDAGVTKFYAVSAATYRALDLTNKDNLTALLTSDNLVGTLTHGNCGEATTGTLNLVLDSDKMATAAASGEVVIIGDSTSGLYGLAGSDTAIVSGWLVTTDGAETVVANNGTYTLPSTAIVYVEDDTDLYAPGAVPTVTSDMTFVGYTDTGLTMVQGAQVRIGYGVGSDGKVGSESGLRFITLQNNIDTVAGLDGVTVGVIVTAEGGTDAATIPATKWQAADNSVFTTALTNLAVTNYNRKFKAYPYVSYTDVLGNEGGAVVSDSYVERSIYQVAAGLLVNASTDDTTYDQTALDSTVLYKVLNAYVNQTGIRLQINDDGLGVYQYKESEKIGASYSGDVFFEVTETAVNGTVYTATIAPVGEKTIINSEYWDEYIRINNNHNMVVNGIDVSSTVNEDGTLTLTFDASLAK